MIIIIIIIIIHKDSAAYTVSASSLTMEVEAVTHYALCWITSRGDCQTTHAIILTASTNLLHKLNSRMRSPDWHNVALFDIHLGRLLWMCCPGQASIKVQDQHTHWREKQPRDLRFRRSETSDRRGEYIWAFPSAWMPS